MIVARGGGSLADLFAFCDEALCRTVALLRVPVIASVGHHTDRTLIDDVAAVCCSTPTHAAEAAVPLDCARGAGGPARCRAPARRATAAARSLERARTLARLAARAGASTSRATAAGCTSSLRELRASARARAASRGPHALAAATRSCSARSRRARRASSERSARAARARAAGAGARRPRPRAHARARLRARRGPRRRAAEVGRRGARGRRRPAALPRRRRRRRRRIAAMTRPSPSATYEAAVARIEEIIRRLDSGEAGLRETLDLVKEGRDLVEYCAGELDAVGKGLEELRLEELVARLEGARGRGATGEHVRPARRPAARRRRLRARGAAGRGLERLRAADARSSTCTAAGSRASARTSSTTPRTTSRSRRPAPVHAARCRTVRAGRLLRAHRLARPVPGGAEARGLAALPPLDVPQRRARPGAARRPGSRCTSASVASRSR